MDSICLCSNKWCSCINITRTAFLATLEVATYFLPQCCGNKICWALGVISGKRRQRGGGSMTAAKWCWHHHRSSMMAAAWQWRQHDSGAIMSVLDIEVQRVRVKLEGNALIDLWRHVVFFQKKKSKSCSIFSHLYKTSTLEKLEWTCWEYLSFLLLYTFYSYISW